MLYYTKKLYEVGDELNWHVVIGSWLSEIGGVGVMDGNEPHHSSGFGMINFQIK